MDTQRGVPAPLRADADQVVGARNNPVKHSLRAAINAKCKQCIYDPESGMGAWRQQVAACTVTRCPLWPVRPLTTAVGATEHD